MFEYILFRKKRKYYKNNLTRWSLFMTFLTCWIFLATWMRKKSWGSTGTIRYLMGKTNKQTMKQPEKALNGSLFQPLPLKILKSKNHVKFLIVEDMLLQARVNSDKSLWVSRAGRRFHMLEIIIGCVLNVIFIKC